MSTFVGGEGKTNPSAIQIAAMSAATTANAANRCDLV
jgi:hypothetical protein